MIENKLMLSQIEIFEKETEHTLEVKDGRPYYKGNLFCISDYLPDNLVVDGGLFCNYSSKKLPKGLKVNGDLDISHSGITEIPDDCKFNSLNISHTKVAKLRDNLTLNYLNIRNTLLTELPKGLKVKGDLDISNTDIMEIPDDCEFGSLFMEGTKITKLRDNLILGDLIASESFLKVLPNGLKVKYELDISDTDITEIPNDCEFGALDISETKIKKLRDNLTLYSLNIINTCLETFPKNLIISNSFFVDDTHFSEIPNDCLVNNIYGRIHLNDEQYKMDRYGNFHLKDDIIHISHPSGREFLHVDEILSEVVEKKGNVYHVRNGVNEPISYVVTDGNNNWAHGKTLEEAKQDLLFKVNERDKSDYENLTLDSELTFDESVVCYRVITGACSFGTQDYLEHRLPKPKKEKYTIKEMIELTKNEYGGKTFQEFFETNITTKK